MSDYKKILDAWDNSLLADEHAHLNKQLERRRFLHTAARASAAAVILPSLLLLNACEQKPPSTEQTKSFDPLTQEPWLTFATVQMILFPDDGNGPSARDLNATAYLKFVLDANDTDKETRDFIYKGIDWLNQLSETTHQKRFIQTNELQQGALISTIANSESGERWLSYLLLYIFEALLTDPAYGANPNGIGWQWLAHQPGFPSPGKDKIYPELLKR